MKKLFILFSSFLIGIHSFAFQEGPVDQKFLSSFEAGFPNAKDVSWIEYPEAYEVSFIKNGIRARILYPKDHSFVRLTRYYNEEHLPYQVLLILKKEFPGKKIFGVTEVSTIVDSGNVLSLSYHVIIEDAKKWFTVKIDKDGSFGIGKRLFKTY